MPDVRVVGEPVTVHAHAGAPDTLYWNDRRHPITRILDTWRWAGRWWRGDPPRDYWLVQTPTLTAELYRSHGGKQGCWTLSRVQD